MTGQWQLTQDLWAGQVHKKPGAKKLVVEPSESVVHQHRPAYKVKSKEERKPTGSGITKAMTQAMGVNGKVENEQGGSPAAEEPNAGVETEADDGCSSDEHLESFRGTATDNSVQPVDPDAAGSWRLARVASKDGFSWRMVPNQDSLDTLQQTDADSSAYDEDDLEDVEGGDEQIDNDDASSSASSGAVVALSAVRAKIKILAQKASEKGKVELGPKGIVPRRTPGSERQAQRERPQQKQSLNLNEESALVQGSSDTTWKLGRKVQI